MLSIDSLYRCALRIIWVAPNSFWIHWIQAWIRVRETDFHFMLGRSFLSEYGHLPLSASCHVTVLLAVHFHFDNHFVLDRIFPLSSLVSVTLVGPNLEWFREIRSGRSLVASCRYLLFHYCSASCLFG